MGNTDYMGYREYMLMVRDYHAQAKLLGEKLEQRKGKKSFASAREREEYENGTQMMIEMKRDCEITEKKLLEIANAVKEAEKSEKYRTDGGENRKNRQRIRGIK